MGDMAVSDVDKLGRDCPEWRPTGERSTMYPVLDAEHKQAMIGELCQSTWSSGMLTDPTGLPADHKWAMIRELYQAGWSYWLIAQLAGMDPAQCREALLTGGASMGASQGV